MRQFVISYQTRPERTADNREAIAAVFAELSATAPPDCRYLVLELDDGSFIHVVEAPDDPDANPISGLAAFKAFSATIRDRLAAPPTLRNATVVGSYGSISSPGSVDAVAGSLST
jgi:hypothetical protein